ncbi:MAG: hypothetical protein ACRD3O_12420, partial [Terriglobia bacterium]
LERRAPEEFPQMLANGKTSSLFANDKGNYPLEGKRYRFLPTDDRLLLGANSFEELQSATDVHL